MVDIEKIDSLKTELEQNKDKFELEIDNLREVRNQEIEKTRKLIYDECFKIFEESTDLKTEVYGFINYADNNEKKADKIKEFKEEIINIICKNSKRVILIKNYLVRVSNSKYRNPIISIGVNQKGFGYMSGYRSKLNSNFNEFVKAYVDCSYYYNQDFYNPEDISNLRGLCIATFTKFAKEKDTSEELIQKIPLIFEKNKGIDNDSLIIEIGLEGDNKIILDRYSLSLRDVAENDGNKKSIKIQNEFSTSSEVDYYLDLNFFSQYKEKIIQAIKDKKAEMDIKNAEIDKIYFELENLLLPYRALKEI